MGTCLRAGENALAGPSVGIELKGYRERFILANDTSAERKGIIMSKEIDILVKAADKSCAVVAKDSHVLWSLEELLEARVTGQFQEEDRFLSPDRYLEVSGPFPGCMHQTGAVASYRVVGQTEHFVIFAPSDAVPLPGPENDSVGCRTEKP